MRVALLVLLALSSAANASEKKAKASQPAAKASRAVSKTPQAATRATEAQQKPDEHAAPAAEVQPLLKAGDAALLFTAPLHNAQVAGKPVVSLSLLVGDEAEDPGVRAVLVSFFATWCKPCKKELPFLGQLAGEYAEKGLRVVSVAIERDEAKWPEIRALLEQNKVTWPVAMDRTGLISRQYLGDKTVLPAVYLLDRQGLVAMVKQGYPQDAETFLRGEVEKALAKPAGEAQAQ
jgi:thiol-disulfide isomerase/thioredoxin